MTASLFPELIFQPRISSTMDILLLAIFVIWVGTIIDIIIKDIRK